jgi:2Fe-2S ferredoxin
MACSTCHIIIDKDWVARLPKATREENDMLDLAQGVTRHSRLGCQIVLTDELDGLVVTIV